MGRVAFTGKAVDQIRETYTRLKAQPFGGSGPKHKPRLWNPGIARAKVTTGITQGSGTSTCGTGAADIWRRQPDGTMAVTENVTVANWATTTGTIPVGTRILIGWVDGEWEFVVRDCP